MKFNLFNSDSVIIYAIDLACQLLIVSADCFGQDAQERCFQSQLDRPG